ncbi:MAG: TolC family protein [Bacteroidetes bacterium]|nr:TolC family protein [Bacteroidota bacterium]
MSIVALSSFAQNVFTLEDVIHRAQSQSPAFRQVETKRETKYWSYRLYRSNYNPQIRLNNFTAGSLYTNSISPIRQPDGTLSYIPINQFNPGANFALQQPIQWTNGQISVNSFYNYFNNISNSSTQWSGTPVNIQLNQPLFSFNQYKWDRRIEPIKFEESKREYAESMEQIARDAATYFFNVLQAQVNLQIAKFNLANNDTIYKIEKGRYNIGSTSEDKLLQVELQLLRSRQDVAQANLDLQTSSLQLRTFIGLRNGESFQLIMPENIPLFEVNEDEALDHAKKTRSAYIAFERRRTEAERDVAIARGSLYQVGITASYGLNNVGAQLGDIYQNPSKQQVANITFNVPVVDWGRRKATMKTAYANKKLQDYVIAQDEVTFEQEILTQVRKFEMLRLQIEITQKSDQVALERYKVSQNRYLIGKIDITNLNIALNEKDNAKRSYIQALNTFWTAYYDLRRFTLYDFSERKYLYDPFAAEK